MLSTLDKVRERALEFRIKMLERNLLKLLEETKTEEGKNSILEMSFFIREAIRNAYECNILDALEYLSNASFHAGIYKQAEKLLEKTEERYEKITKILDNVTAEIRDILESKCGCKSRKL
jgi:formiminotetrahydrofolate cyclodeaminase